MQFIIPFFIATAIPLICLWIIYKRNLYSTSQIAIVILCFCWGVIGFFIAVQVNVFIRSSFHMDNASVSRYVAPFTEEIIKAALLIYLVRRPVFNYFVDGAIYGFAAGIGFAVIENYDYINGYESIALTVAIGRSLSTNLIHASASALVGITLGMARFQKGIARQLLFAVGGLIAAILMHGGYNNMVSRVSGEIWLVYLYAIIVGFSCAAFIIWLIQRGLSEERGWIDEMLGLADRVTQGESRMVLRLAEAGALLAPIAEHFGKQKAAEIARLLAVQAQLGILRKAAQIAPDEKMQRDVENKIFGLQNEMSVLRNQIGVYPMLFLRSIFPDDNLSVWNRLEAATIEQTEKPAKTESKDFSVSDILHDLPTHQRRVMQAMMRGLKRASLLDLQTELGRAQNQPMSEREVVDAADELLKAGKLARVEGSSNLYEVKFKHKTGLSLNENIWDRLSVLSQEPSAGGADVWGGLKTLLAEQAQTQKNPQGKDLWATLAKRIP